MKLVRTVEEKSLRDRKMAIYKLSEEEKRKHRGNFALSQGVFSDYAFEETGVDKLLSGLNIFCYEGFFDTEKEAYLYAKLFFMEQKVKRLEFEIKKLFGLTEELKTPEWVERGASDASKN